MYKRFFTVIVTAVLAVIPFNMIFAAPTDFDGDGDSDPASVEAKQNLQWQSAQDGTSTVIVRRYGKLGNHLAPAKYSASGVTEPAHINSEGRWSVMVNGEKLRFDHGAEGATYLAGADVDGDGKADALYHDNRCRKQKTTLFAKLDPLSSQSSIRTVTGGKGVNLTFYADINGDGRDDFCWLEPLKVGKKITRRFRSICKDITSGKRITKFRVGKVFNRPIPLKTPGKPDRLVFYKSTKKTITAAVKNKNGKNLRKRVVLPKGELLVGNYTNTSGQAEQLAVALDNSIEVYDVDSRVRSSILAPAGIKFDEVNVNHFESELNSCACTSSRIQKTGACRALKSGFCAVERDITDGGGNWLHKPESDNTGNIVNLFNPSDNPKNCRYLSSDGEVVREAFYSGPSNPNRPTWRPEGGGSCRDFPANMIVACEVKGEQHCWRIPKPCQRYD